MGHRSVKAVANEALRSVMTRVKKPVVDRDVAIHYCRSTADDIERFIARPDAPRKQTPALPTPPGDPIGN